MRALLLLPLLAATLPAQSPIPAAEQQIAAAVLPLPQDLRANATVMGYREAGKLVVLRAGTNGMHCLALYVTRPDFHVACYHKDLEPFMARGRELRAEGVTGAQVDSVRFREVRDRKLPMPAMGTLYSITTKRENFDAAANKVNGAPGLLAVIYVPNATPQSTGITAQPRADGPWLMFPGTLKAHIMMVGTMSP
ncbi:MAG: hypothetical protein IPJ78_08315 [Gemmatimonadetes bacterium]|nr:hypothetical protein [Gemmatimonadota bacterium]